MSQVSTLVDAVMGVLDGYLPPGGSFEGRRGETYALVPSDRVAIFRAELGEAIKHTLEEQESHVTAGDVLLRLQDKLMEVARRDIAKEAKQQGEMQRAAELLSGLSPEDQEAVKAALLKGKP